MKVRWDRLRVGDMVDMSPQPVMPVVSRRYDERSGLWMLGFLHPGWRRVWRIGYVGDHEEEVVVPWGLPEGDFYERELVIWMDYALQLRDLLRHQNKALYEAARERDRLLVDEWAKREHQRRVDQCLAAFGLDDDEE